VHLPHAAESRRQPECGVAAHEGAREPVVRQPPVGEVGHAESAGTRCGVADGAGVGRRARERLLAAHVEPRVEGGLGDRPVQVVGRRDHDRVDVGPCDQRLPPRLDRGSPVAGVGDESGHVVGTRPVAPAQRHQLRRRVAEQRREVHPLDPPARADDGDAGGEGHVRGLRVQGERAVAPAGNLEAAPRVAAPTPTPTVMTHAPAFLKLVDEARTHVPEVDVDEALARQAAGAHLVDVREESEWAAGHAAGATHLGKGVIERDVEGRIPSRDAEVLLYCGGGFRSLLAGDALRRMGYTNVRSVAGGWRAWQEAGAPVDRDR
jgi:rhodanese-related sulfurtransferase